jgi:hypothetical protein
MAAKKETGKKVPVKKDVSKTERPKTDARDVIDFANESGELNTVIVKSLTNIEEYVEAIDWKLWEIYNMVKTEVENRRYGPGSPAGSAENLREVIQQELAKALEGPAADATNVGKIFDK